MGAQYGQPYQVEDVLGLKTSKKDTKKGFFIEAGAAGMVLKRCILAFSIYDDELAQATPIPSY